MSDISTIKRQLLIKTNVVKRLSKEEDSYLLEAKQQQDRIQLFIDNEKDEYELKQQKKVLQDCLKMLPDSRRRLTLALDELDEFLERLNDNNESLKVEQEFKNAKEIVEITKEKLKLPLPSI